MNLSARISYIKGLAEGLNLDENKDEVKVLNEIIDFLGQLADEVEELEECYDESVDIVDTLNDDLSMLEDVVYGDDDEDLDKFSCSTGCKGCCTSQNDDSTDEADVPMYEVTCPQCNKKIAVSENQLLTGEVECPDCDAVLEFDLDGIANNEEEQDIKF